MQNSKLKTFRSQAGQLLVEIILAIALSAIVLPALLVGLVSSREGKAQQSQRTEAVYLLNETVDAVRSIREKSWISVSTNGIFHPIINGSSWELASGTTIVNSFTQSVAISDVYRDSNGAIVASPGTLDPSSKKVDVSISWGQPYISTVSANLYITRYLDNSAFIQTSESDFNAGLTSGTDVTNTLGGEVTLGAGQGDWCAPNLSIPALDLPGSGVANAIAAIEGKVFVGTGENASGLAFADVDISNTKPPVVSLGGIFNGHKTNGVFGEQNYGYIATDTNAKEIVIIDLNKIVDGQYQEAGYFDAPSSDDGNSVFVSGNIGYMTSDDMLYSFDLSSKVGSRPILDSNGVDVGDEAYKVFVVGTYAYVAVDAPAYELQIVDVSDPSNLTVVGGLDIDPGALVSGENGLDVFVNPSGTRAYLVTSTFPALQEFFIINITSKSNPVIVGRYDTNGMDPKGLTVVSGNKAIVAGYGEEEYQVIDITNEAIPIKCGGLHVNTGINGIYSVIEEDGDAYSYLVTEDESSEFKVIEGGTGGVYASSGEFTSSIFDSLFSTSFNRFDASINRPNSSDIQFQVAVSEALNGSCDKASFTFVGPNATSSTFFTTSETSGIQVFNFSVPLSLNPGRCFKYKAYFSTSDPLSTSIFYDMTVNYSP